MPRKLRDKVTRLAPGDRKTLISSGFGLSFSAGFG